MHTHTLKYMYTYIHTHKHTYIHYIQIKFGSAFSIFTNTVHLNFWISLNENDWCSYADDCLFYVSCIHSALLIQWRIWFVKCCSLITKVRIMSFDAVLIILSYFRLCHCTEQIGILRSSYVNLSYGVQW